MYVSVSTINKWRGRKFLKNLINGGRGRGGGGLNQRGEFFGKFNKRQRVCLNKRREHNESDSDKQQRLNLKR